MGTFFHKFRIQKKIFTLPHSLYNSLEAERHNRNHFHCQEWSVSEISWRDDLGKVGRAGSLVSCRFATEHSSWLRVAETFYVTLI